MQMVSAYSNFMVFKLKNTGERIRLNITEKDFSKDNGSTVLKSDEVIIIVKEDIRRIYIWKGIESSVRKKFIASRVATSLQKELINEAHFHRCKIVSIDEGDELKEFIQNFRFDEEMLEKRELPEIPSKREFRSYSPQISKNSHVANPSQSFSQIPNYKRSPQLNVKPNKPIKKENKKTLEKILDNEHPPNYKRRHVLIGNSELYGAVEKKSKIFGKEISELEWEPITSFSRKILELDGFKLRIYTDKDMKSVDAIEILEKISEKSIVTQKEETPEVKIAEKSQIKPIKLTKLNRLGPKTEEKFREVGIDSVNELIDKDPGELAKKIDGASQNTIKKWIEEGKKLLE
ncbi:MAG: helix-hairpin-helix domain-containing protein [Promethearchaeati archaeon]